MVEIPFKPLAISRKSLDISNRFEDNRFHIVACEGVVLSILHHHHACPSCKEGEVSRIRRDRKWMSLIPESKLYRCNACKTEFLQARFLRLNLGKKEQNPILAMMQRRKLLTTILIIILVILTCGFVIGQLDEQDPE